MWRLLQPVAQMNVVDVVVVGLADHLPDAEADVLWREHEPLELEQVLGGAHAELEHGGPVLLPAEARGEALSQDETCHNTKYSVSFNILS